MLYDQRCNNIYAQNKLVYIYLTKMIMLWNPNITQFIRQIKVKIILRFDAIGLLVYWSIYWFEWFGTKQSNFITINETIFSLS